jgi:hypothetical protein
MASMSTEPYPARARIVPVSNREALQLAAAHSTLAAIVALTECPIHGAHRRLDLIRELAQHTLNYQRS